MVILTRQEQVLSHLLVNWVSEIILVFRLKNVKLCLLFVFYLITYLYKKNYIQLLRNSNSPCTKSLLWIACWILNNSVIQSLKMCVVLQAYVKIESVKKTYLKKTFCNVIQKKRTDLNLRNIL